MGARADEVRSEIERTRADLGQTLDAIGDRMSPRQIARRRTRRIAHGLHVVRDSVMGTTGQVTSSIGDTASSAKAGLKSAAEAIPAPSEMSETITSQTQGNPLAAGVIAFTGGLLLATALPPTPPEQRGASQLAEQAQPLVNAAQEAAAELKDGMRASLQGAVENVREAASQSASEVGEQAKAAVGEVGTQAKEAASPSDT